MVSRRPKAHAAEVVVSVDGHVENGEWVPGETRSIPITGRFDCSNSSRHVLKRDGNGNLLEVYGEYYTPCRAPKEGLKAPVLRIAGLGIERPIISWEDYQMHSVIYV